MKVKVKKVNEKTKEHSPIINKNLQIPSVVHFHSILEQISLVIIVYLVNLNHCQSFRIKIKIIFAHQLWWDGFDHPLEVCIFFLGGCWVAALIDQLSQFYDYWPCSNVFFLKFFDCIFDFNKVLSHPTRFHARDTEVKVAVSTASSEVFLTSPR